MDNRDDGLIDNTTEAVVSTSQVTPKKKVGFIKTPAFTVVVSLVSVFLIMGYFSGRVVSKELSSDQSVVTSRKNQTLNQNLKTIDVLQSNEEKLHREQEEKRMKEFLANQAKPNYTATTDGKKIGNPKTFRQAPSDRARARKKALSKEMIDRMNAPTTFVNVDYNNSDGSKITNQKTINGKLLAGNGSNSGFVNQDNSISFTKATKLSHPEFIVAAGEMIEATLETAITSELPGMIRAVTTRDIYSLDASNLLIPKGSHLVGQYSSGGITQTQTRVLVAWTRVQMSDGTVATLNSPSTDRLGRAGQGADYINRHFIAKFGTSALFSVLGAYTANTGVNGMDGYNSASQYRMSLAQSFQKTSSDILGKAVDIPPTLKIHQGTKINVFVARDVSFYDVGSKGEGYERTK